MYTRCPNCSTFFAVDAEQLGAANGRVRCGSCLFIFDGLKHLTERPTRAEAGAASSGNRAAPSDPGAAGENAWATQVDADAFDNESRSKVPPTLDENDAVDADEVP